MLQEPFIPPLGSVRLRNPITIDVAKLAKFTPQYGYRGPFKNDFSGKYVLSEYILDKQTHEIVIGFDARTEDGKFAEIISHRSPKDFAFYLTSIHDESATSIFVALKEADVELPVLTKYEKQMLVVQAEHQNQLQELLKKTNEIGQPEHAGTFENAKTVLQHQVGYGSCCNVKENILATFGAGPCIIVAIYNPTSKEAALVHLDSMTKISSTLGQMFSRMKTDGSTLEVHLRGGNPSTRDMGMNVLSDITNRDGVVIKSSNLNQDHNFDIKDLAIDACTGKVYTQFSLKQLNLSGAEMNLNIIQIQLEMMNGKTNARVAFDTRNEEGTCDILDASCPVIFILQEPFIPPLGSVRLRNPITIDVAKLAKFTPQYGYRGPFKDDLSGKYELSEYILDNQTHEIVIGFDARTEGGKFAEIISHRSPKDFAFYLTSIHDESATSIFVVLKEAGVELPVLTKYEKQMLVAQAEHQNQLQELLKKTNEIGQPEHAGTFENAKTVLQHQVGYGSCCNVKENILATFGAGPCIIVAIYNPTSKEAALVHLDSMTKISSTLGQMFSRMKTDGSTLEVHLRGGNPSTRDMGMNVLSDITNRDGVVIKSSNLNQDYNFDTKDLAIDACTGKVYTQFSPKQLNLSGVEMNLNIIQIQFEMMNGKTNARVAFDTRNEEGTCDILDASHPVIPYHIMLQEPFIPPLDSVRFIPPLDSVRFIRPSGSVRLRNPITIDVAKLAKFTPQYGYRGPLKDDLSGKYELSEYILDKQTDEIVIGFDARTEDGKFAEIISHRSPKDFAFYLTSIHDESATSIFVALKEAGVELPVLTKYEKQMLVAQAEHQNQLQELLKKTNEIGQPEHAGTFENAKTVLEHQVGYGSCCNVKENILATFGAGPCIIVAIYNPTSKEAALVHLDSMTKISSTLGQMFSRMKTDGSTLEVHLRGGDPSTRDMGMNVLSDITNRDGVVIKSSNLNQDYNFDTKDLAIDACTGKVYTQFSPKQLNLSGVEMNLNIIQIQFEMMNGKTNARVAFDTRNEEGTCDILDASHPVKESESVGKINIDGEEQPLIV